MVHAIWIGAWLRWQSSAGKNHLVSLFTRITLVLVMIAASGGCVRRVVNITSDPDGAQVWMNDREVGITPLEVEIIYYGVYDVQISRDGYQTLTTSGDAAPPVWDVPGVDLFAELTPADLVSRNEWHYVLLQDVHDEEAILERAQQLKDQTATP